MTGDFAEFGRLEKDGWSDPSTAKAYATGFASAASYAVPYLVRAVGIEPGHKALDLCCGHGIVAAGLVAAGAQTTGLDFSPAMLEIARGLVPAAAFIEGDAKDLPYDDANFDAVTMGFGMLHLSDAEAVLKEVHRVLKPRGRFAYSVWHGPELSPAFRIVFGAIEMLGDPSVALPDGPPLHAWADAEVAFPALEAAGFSDPSLETVGSRWTMDDPGKPFDHFLEGTVRGAMLLRAQPEANKTVIRSAVIDAVIAELGSGPPWTLPIPAAVVSATA